ncbi:hypothetical protein SDC9_114046 [bioreactor metagenome]|uniref:Uncharacterized protein n=1 Tax=bioreactor metagenome TaxID=1076179 RepID=A0A645BNS6_9ZZZZ
MPHPAGIKKGKLALLGRFDEILPQKRLAALFLGGHGTGPHLKKAGVNGVDHPAQHAALACGAPALDQYQHRQLCGAHLLLLQHNFFFTGLDALFQLCFVRGFAHFKISQHGIRPPLCKAAGCVTTYSPRRDSISSIITF